MLVIAFAAFPVTAVAEDWKVHALSPGYSAPVDQGDNIVIGKDVTFEWNETAWARDQYRFKLKSTAEQQDIVSPHGTFTYENFPLGSSWWSVSVRARHSWIGNTSKQSFYHYNNVPGLVTYKNPDLYEPVPPATISASHTFKYKHGARNLDMTRDLTVFYEILRDYTVDVRSHFDEEADLDHLPKHTCDVCKWQRTDTQRISLLNHIDSLEPIDWEFLSFKNGILTLKKGYRWDGTSNPWIGEEGIKDLRASGVHDAFYDLMRMGFLNPHPSNAKWGDAGYKNKLIADIMWYIDSVEDGRKTSYAFTNFKTLRAFSGKFTRNEDLLFPWKFHISGLTAWVSDGEIELHWMPADIGLNVGGEQYGQGLHAYDIYRATSGSSTWGERIGTTGWQFWDIGYQNDTIHFIDPNVENGKIYYYWVRKVMVDSDGDGWTDMEEINHYGGGLGFSNAKDPDKHPPYEIKRHDETDVEAAVPVDIDAGDPAIGLGSYLTLDGVDDFVEANTVSGDMQHSGAIPPGEPYFEPMTLEVRVYPATDQTSDKAAILAFNTPDGGPYYKLTFDSSDIDNPQFCFAGADDVDKCGGVDEFIPNDWYHVAVTIAVDGSGSLLVNGAEVEKITAIETDGESLQTALFSIGQAYAGTARTGHFKGHIDEVRVWNLARTQTQVEANMDRAIDGHHDGLVGHWHLDEPEDIYTAYDVSINSNDGIVWGKAGPVCDDPDDIPPMIQCQDSDTIDPNDTPISFTATASDNCGVATVEVIGHDCYKYTKKGKLVDKTGDCVVEYQDDTVTILHSSGVGTNIVWTVTATDVNGKTSEVSCEVPVLIPGKNKEQ